MVRLRIAKPVRPALLDQLQARGIVPLKPDGTTVLQPDADGQGGWLEVRDADAATAQQAIDAHDAAAIDAARAQEEVDDQADRDAARLAIAVLLADAARLEDPAQAMTAQAIRNHQARTNRTVAALLRVLRRRGVI